MSVWVDIPQAKNVYAKNDDDTAYLNVGTFSNRDEAIKFAMEWFGADKDGMICLVTGYDDNEKEEVTR